MAGKKKNKESAHLVVIEEFNEYLESNVLDGKFCLRNLCVFIAKNESFI